MGWASLAQSNNDPLCSKPLWDADLYGNELNYKDQTHRQ